MQQGGYISIFLNEILKSFLENFKVIIAEKSDLYLILNEHVSSHWYFTSLLVTNIPPSCLFLTALTITLVYDELD